MLFSSDASVFSTRECAAGEKTDYWREVVCKLFTPLTPRFVDAQQFEGTVCQQRRDMVDIAEISAGAQSVRHGPGEIRRTDQHLAFFIVHLAGSAFFEVPTGASRLQAGDMLVVSTDHPYEFAFAGAFRQLCIAVPHAALGGRWDDVALSSIGRIPGRGADLARYLESTDLDPARDAGCTALLERHLVEYLWILTASAGRTVDAAARPPSSLRLAAIERVISQQYRDPELCPTQVAAALGISVRSLYKAFEGTPTTFAGALLKQRLDAARVLLGTDGVRGRSIADIAYAVGFADLSHFNRRFKRHFQVTPRAYIAMHRDGA